VAGEILERILARRRERLAGCPGGRESGEATAAAFAERIHRAPAPRSLVAALRAGARPAVIAELKRASPTAGPIAAGADATAVASLYAAAGAAALSILTEPDFFSGSLADLDRARTGAPNTPLLRKDFLLTAEDVAVARAAGADAILLIVRALPPALLGELLATARRLGMDALVEVHSEAECETALAAGALVIGVNHRDLATFAIDLGLTARLRPRVPASVVLVAESGLRTTDDVRRVVGDGADAILVGEALMREADPGGALARLVGPVWGRA